MYISKKRFEATKLSFLQLYLPVTKQTIFPIRQIKKVSKAAKIRNRYNQVSQLTLDTNAKVTNLQLDTTNESQEVSLFPAGDHDHKAQLIKFAQRHNKRHKTEKSITDQLKKYRLGTVSKSILLEALNRFQGTNLTLYSDDDQDT